MAKFNGPKLDHVILAGHLHMHNMNNYARKDKSGFLICLLAIGMMVYVALR